MKLKILLAASIFVGASFVAESRDFRVNQIPNGGKFQCNTCHTNGGGSKRNAFGTLIEQNLVNGNVVWNESLAKADSDGDGFTNGQELLDPNGTWKTGQQNPGNLSDVYNPGSKNSVPTSVIENSFNRSNEIISMLSVSPNPVFESAQINYYLKTSGIVEIGIYDIDGGKVMNLYSSFTESGRNSFSIDLNSLNNSLSSGSYLLVIKSGDAMVIDKIIIR